MDRRIMRTIVAVDDHFDRGREGKAFNSRVGNRERNETLIAASFVEKRSARKNLPGAREIKPALKVHPRQETS